MMNARNAAGRQVSLLNDDPIYHQPSPVVPQRLSYSTASHVVSQPYRPSLTRSESSSPHTPQLLRSDSYDSQASEPLSPMTPNLMFADYTQSAAGPVDVYTTEPRSPYEDFLSDSHSLAHAHIPAGSKRPSAFPMGGNGQRRSVSYDHDPTSPSAAPTAERSGKRYPCRYRETHGCEKTFTTSGHASRHSKIHTAEKAVICTHSGCTKKFTRADNMKQHLETHYKDKNRATGVSRPSLSGGRRSSSASKHGSGTKPIDFNPSGTPLPSPGVSQSTWNMPSLNGPLAHRPSSGLDALAAIACQADC